MSAPFQFVWYGFGDGAWKRLRLDHFEGGMRYVYRWRLCIGPLDIRRWRPQAEGLAGWINRRNGDANKARK